MDNLTATANLKIQVTASKNRTTPGGVTPIPFNPAIARAFKYGFGLGASEVNQNFEHSQVIAAGATYTLALRGVLTNWINEAVTLAELKMLWLENFSAVDNIIVRPAVANGMLGLFEDPSGLIIKPKTGILIATEDAAGYPVTAPNNALEFVNGLTGPSTLGVLILGSQ